MKSDFLSKAGWHALVFIILFSPLIQGGAPRLPLAVVQCTIGLVLVAWLFEWGWKAPCQSLRVTALDVILALFLFWAVFSMLFAPYHHSAEKALLFLFSGSALYWWLVFHPSLRGLHRALTAAVLQGLFQGGMVWYQWGVKGLARPSGTFYNPNFLACLLAATAILCLGRAVFPPPEDRRRWGKFFFWLFAAAFVSGAMLLTGSRGGALSLTAGLVVLLGGRSIRLALGGGAGVLLGLVAVPNPWIDRIADLGRLDVYAYSRIAIWKSALKMTADHPGFGVGLGQFKYFAPRYAFPVETHWARFGKVAETAHNEYLQAAAELGVPGLVLAAAAVAFVLVWAFRGVRRQPVAERGPVATLLAALTVLLVHAAVDFPLHVTPVAVLLVLLAAGLRIHGSGGPAWIVDIRFRKVYAVPLMVLSLLGMVQAARPPVAFRYFLGGIGSPQNLFREKWALEEAPKEIVDGGESLRLLERAVAVDPRSAPYHHSLGSMYFQDSLRHDDPERLQQRGLYHANYAAALNPNSYRYAVSLQQAMESLFRITGDRAFLMEAVEHQRRAVLLGPKRYVLHEKLALLAEEAGLFEEARESFREVVRLEPNYLRGWFNLGTFLARRGEREEALRTLVRGRELARERGRSEPSSTYESALVDFDVGLFDNRIQDIEKEKETSYQ